MEWEVGSDSHSTEGVQGSLCYVMVSPESKPFSLGAKLVNTQDVNGEVKEGILRQYVCREIKQQGILRGTH